MPCARMASPGRDGFGAGGLGVLLHADYVASRYVLLLLLLLLLLIVLLAGCHPL